VSGAPRLVEDATSEASRQELETRLKELELENSKLKTVRDALIRQVDRSHDFTGNAFKLFQSVAEMETSVEKRIQRLARAMSEAKIARQQLQQAIDAIGEGFILYDSNDRIVLCNRKYRDFFPGLQDILKPGTHFNEIVRMAAETGLIVEAVTDPEAWISSRVEYHRRRSCQFQQLLSDGRWIQISERITNDGGKVTIVTEITHFVRLEETRRLTKVAKQSGLLATTVANIAQGVVVFDPEFKLVAWNSQSAMLLNLPYAGMYAGMRLKDLVRQVRRFGAEVPKERQREALEWINNVRKRYPLRIELSYRGRRFVAANFRTMPDDSFVVTMTDVSAQMKAAKLLEQSKEELEKRVDERTLELRRLNEILQDEVLRHEQTAADLERARKAAESANLGKTRFLAAASHDLLQPLNAARLYLSALEASPLVDPGARGLLDNIGKAFQSTEALLSTLLDISKMDAGGYRPRLAAVKVGELFETLEAEFGALARQKGLRLRRVACSAIVRTDAQLLRRIVQNLLSNALKYTDSGSILLGARRRGDSLSIEIHDSGYGIAAENHQAIFEEFKRAAPAGSQTTGLGLGLAIVKRAADLLGHQVALQSHVGRGSCFSLTVPLLPAEFGKDADPASFEPPLAHGRATAGTGIPLADGPLFVLENDPGVADAMTTLFDYWNLTSITAPSYPALLEATKGEKPTPKAVIADLHLDGDVDGIDAIVLLRQRLGQNLPGILVTADQSREVKERAKAAGIEYFSKPMKPAQLRAYLFHLSMDTRSDSDLALGVED
jgi:two-component system, sensor histidine kinase